MKFIHALFLSCFCLTLSFSETITEEDTNVIIILDSSGSMWGEIEGVPKINIAREAINKIIQVLPDTTNLGLVAYGHREKGKCDDIELLVKPSKVDKESFTEVVNQIIPKGKTPLTDAVVFAAEQLSYEEQKSSVILISDGKETCDQDPCIISTKLEQLGIDFTAHVIAFDLSEEDAQSIKCIADNTGGMFIMANSAENLQGALEVTVNKADAVQIAEEEATVNAPTEVEVGSDFQVTWTGPNNEGDQIKIIHKEVEDKAYSNYASTKKGSPLTLKALMKEGEAEIRYVTSGNKILGRSSLMLTPAKAKIIAPPTVNAGSKFKIEWTGPNNDIDYISIQSSQKEFENVTAPGLDDNASYTNSEPILFLEAPVIPGAYTIYYVAEQKDDQRLPVTLAKKPIKVVEATSLLTCPAEVDIGNTFSIEWEGPDNDDDYITILPEGTLIEKQNTSVTNDKNSDWTSEGSPLLLEAPVIPGRYEVFYVTGQQDKENKPLTLFKKTIVVNAVQATITAPENAKVGEELLVEWTGPNNKGDQILILPASAPIKSHYENREYTKYGNPAKFDAPDEAGDYKLYYVLGQKDPDRNLVTIGSTSIKLIE